MPLQKAMAASAGANSTSEITTPQQECPLEVSEEAVAKLAYKYWEERGCEGGSPEEDWYRALEHLRASAQSE